MTNKKVSTLMSSKDTLMIEGKISRNLSGIVKDPVEMLNVPKGETLHVANGNLIHLFVHSEIFQKSVWTSYFAEKDTVVHGPALAWVESEGDYSKRTGEAVSFMSLSKKAVIASSLIKNGIYAAAFFAFSFLLLSITHAVMPVANNDVAALSQAGSSEPGLSSLITLFGGVGGICLFLVSLVFFAKFAIGLFSLFVRGSTKKRRIFDSIPSDIMKSNNIDALSANQV